MPGYIRWKAKQKMVNHHNASLVPSPSYMSRAPAARAELTTQQEAYMYQTQKCVRSPQNGHPLCGRKDSISRLHVIASVALASHVACTPHRLCASWVVSDCQARRRRLGFFVVCGLGVGSFGDHLVIPPLCECETRQESCRPWAPWGARL